MSKQTIGRNEALQKVFQAALRASLEKLSEKNLTQSFPQLDEEELGVVCTETRGFVTEAAEDEFKEIVNRFGVASKLDAFDAIISGHGRKVDANALSEADLHTWIHPHEFVHCQVLQRKLEKEEQMRRSVQLIEDENDALAVTQQQLIAESQRLKSEIATILSAM